MRLVNYISIIILASAIVSLTAVKSNAQGDPYVDAGGDTSVTCANPCVDLIGSYFYA